MECGRRDGSRDWLTENVPQSQPQLSGGANAERHREDLPRPRHPASQKPSYSVNQRAGLPAPGPAMISNGPAPKVTACACSAVRSSRSAVWSCGRDGAAAALSCAIGWCNIHLPSGGWLGADVCPVSARQARTGACTYSAFVLLLRPGPRGLDQLALTTMRPRAARSEAWSWGGRNLQLRRAPNSTMALARF
jgi:hypothetical protein